MGRNAGLAALVGPARRIDTVAGFMSWRLGVLSIIGAIWGLLIATRLMRGEEEAGRWELLLSGQTTRRRAAGQALVGLAAGLVALCALTALLTAAEGSRSSVDFSMSASLFYALAASASAAMFVAIGALAGQLAATRRQANAIAAAVFGASFLIRMVADSGGGLEWLRWASPLGWVEELRPLIGTRPLALLPISGLVVVSVAGAIVVAGRRDLGASVLASRDSRSTAYRPARRSLGSHDSSGPAGRAGLDRRTRRTGPGDGTRRPIGVHGDQRLEDHRAGDSSPRRLSRRRRVLPRARLPHCRRARRVRRCGSDLSNP